MVEKKWFYMLRRNMIYGGALVGWVVVVVEGVVNDPVTTDDVRVEHRKVLLSS